MAMNYKLYNSTYKHKKGTKLPLEESLNLKVLKGEKFAFQIVLESQEKTLISLGEYSHIGYKGLNIKRIRLDIENVRESDISPYFLGYVLDDETKESIVDPILKEKYKYTEDKTPTIIWVEGSIDKTFKDETLEILIKFIGQKNYEKEVVEKVIKVNIEVIDIVLPKLKETTFHLDLWQHLSSWARNYDLPFWGEDHFKVIENFINELASMGEKVITVVASDFSWVGQGCYEIEENPTNLFEHNLIKVTRNEKGKVSCNFESLKKYLGICFKYGIKDEIDIFGLLGNWEKNKFGNPLKDYDDPIRISIYCELTKTYSYIDNKKELGEYINQLFEFFKIENLLEKIRIISDMPDNPKLLKGWINFLKESANYDIPIKTALHENKFIDELKGISDISFSLPLLLQNKEKLEKIKKNLKGKLSWYVCWFPNKINHFISSPLIESRLTGWYSYYMGLDGFLRWDYALWTSNPFDNISYKYPKWKAGDMFFVYPGKDMKPIRSIRWENLRFGLQDQEILKMAEKKVGKKEINRLLLDVFGKKENMIRTEKFTIDLEYSLEYKKYMDIKSRLIEVLKGR